VALVTGAAREKGIGRGVALCLAEEGADIIINDVTEMAQAEQRKKEIQALGRRTMVYQADVSKRDQVEAMVKAAVERFGKIDILVNNAGVCVWQPFLEVTKDAWDYIMGVNLKGAFNCCQAVAKHMIERGQGGRIVIISSVHAQMPFPTMAVYGATKAGLQLLTYSMAIELAKYRINVNHIGPGWVRSDINNNSPSLKTEEDIQRTLKLIPAGRPADPKEMGRGVVYLCSSDGDYVSGAYLRIDGGFVVSKY
jgi:NAD(P)-dependent dehydrogenase (short-subunit alcohol dehydrogenase family)